MNVKITMTGFVQALTAVQAIGAAGKAVHGPLATFGSTAVYAGVIETGVRGGRMWRRAGPALMFKKGVSEAAAAAPAILGPAILKGAAAVGQAKARIRTLGVERIRAYTPVRSGKLRASVRELNRPGG